MAQAAPAAPSESSDNVAGATEEESTDSGAVIENDPSSFPGSAAVYQRIESSRNCVALQREFDVAMTNAEAREPGHPLRAMSITYAEAANNRMKEVGRYG